MASLLRRLRRVLWQNASVAVCTSAVVLLGGCTQRGEPMACLDKRQESRNLALQGELDRAGALLDEVKAMCGANSASDIQHIAKLIAEKTEARERAERAEAAKQELAQKFPGQAFVAWATARDGDVAGKTPSVRCGERGSADYGFCEGARAEDPAMSVRYWETEPRAYRYSLITQRAPSCEDLGEHRQVRVWSRDGALHELCELTSRKLRHLSALVTHAPDEHRMYIFSNSYLARDPAFEQTLRLIQPAR
jgi:hypothetical protein